MTETETRDHVLTATRAYLDLLRAQDWDAWIDLWAEDAILEFPYAPRPENRLYRGREAILAYMSTTTESVAIDSVTDLEIFPMLDPEKVAVELEIAGRILHNDAPYNQRYVTVFFFADGKIQRYREYWNPMIAIAAHGDRDAFAGLPTGSLS